MTIEELRIKNQIFKLEKLRLRKPSQSTIIDIQIKQLETQLNKFGEK